MNKFFGHNNIKRILSFVMLAIICVSTLLACQRNKDTPFSPNTDIGVWWWHTSEKTGIPSDKIEWASQNGVKEIYYCNESFSSKSIARQKEFIEKASEYDIKVYLLLGEYQWINDDTDFISIMDKYTEYQNQEAENTRFCGVHLDVEPHQSPDWHENRAELLNNYLNFIIRNVEKYKNVSFDIDIPFWLTDEVSYKGNTVPLYQALITEVNKVVIMSYRDTADKMYNLGKVPQQIEFAKTLGKPIFLSAECDGNDDDEGTIIHYGNKGKAQMYAELNKLKAMANYEKFGIAIHHIKSWLNMKN